MRSEKGACSCHKGFRQSQILVIWVEPAYALVKALMHAFTAAFSVHCFNHSGECGKGLLSRPVHELSFVVAKIPRDNSTDESQEASLRASLLVLEGSSLVVVLVAVIVNDGHGVCVGTGDFLESSSGGTFRQQSSGSGEPHVSHPIGYFVSR